MGLGTKPAQKSCNLDPNFDRSEQNPTLGTYFSPDLHQILDQGLEVPPAESRDVLNESIDRPTF